MVVKNVLSENAPENIESDQAGEAVYSKEQEKGNDDLSKALMSSEEPQEEQGETEACTDQCDGVDVVENVECL